MGELIVGLAAGIAVCLVVNSAIVKFFEFIGRRLPKRPPKPRKVWARDGDKVWYDRD